MIQEPNQRKIKTYVFNEYGLEQIKNYITTNEVDKLELIVNPHPVKLLNRKSLFLIDVFDTFIEPKVTQEDEMTYERLGAVAMTKSKTVRKGFENFLRHYHIIGKYIGINSDSLWAYEFEELNKHWLFGDRVQKYFGSEYCDWEQVVDEPKKENNILSFIETITPVKNFDKMREEFNIPRNKTLIIGDGKSDIQGAVRASIDILIIPNYKMKRLFDYNSLI